MSYESEEKLAFRGSIMVLRVSNLDLLFVLEFEILGLAFYFLLILASTIILLMFLYRYPIFKVGHFGIHSFNLASSLPDSGLGFNIEKC